MRIVNEPTAAALVYEAGQHEGKRILVYDLGGGTFDVSVVRIEEGVVEVISSHGNNHLGGDDFDQKIVAHILGHLKIREAVDVSAEPRAMARILRAAEAAKRHLSDHPFARIEEEYLTEVGGKPVHLSMELARSEYEARSHPISRRPCRRSIQRCDPPTSLLRRSKDPVVGARAHADDPAPSGGGVRPRTARRGGGRSVRGAGRGDRRRGDRRGRGFRRAGRCDAVHVRHQCARRIRGSVYPFSYVPIIPRNTPIPVRKSEVFFTVADDQTQVDVRIYQGENADALQNIQIGEFRVEGLSKAPAGNEVVLDLALDRDGILHVAAREKKTGLERRISIDQAVTRYEAAELQQARERIGSLFGETRAETALEGDAGGDAVIAALLDKARAKLDVVGDEDGREMIDLIEAVRDSQAADDAAALDQARGQLADLLFYLET